MPYWKFFAHSSILPGLTFLLLIHIIGAEPVLKPLNGSTKNGGILVIDPGPYGITGRVKREFAGVDETLSAKLLQFVTRLSPKTKDRLEHRHYGLQLGLDWETVIPETDARSIRAKAIRAKARAGGRD